MGLSTPKILLFDFQTLKGNNYAAWKTKFQALMEVEDLWEVVNGIVQLLEMTKHYMTNTAILDDVQPHVCDSKTGVNAWKKLLQVYELKNENQFLHL